MVDGAVDGAADGAAGGAAGGGDPAEALADRLRGSGYRLTAQRTQVLRAVEELGHATPDEVLAHLREGPSPVNASTVYRTLEVLEELGLVRHAHLSDRAPTYHSTSGPTHFHLVYRNCSRVRSVAPDVARPLAEALKDEHGFVVDLGHLAVFGHCRTCPPGPDDTHRDTHHDTHHGEDHTHG